MSNPYSDDPQWNPYAGPQVPMGQPAYGPHQPPPGSNGLGVTSLVMGVGGLVMISGLMCCGPLLFVNMAVAVIGLALGWIGYGQALRGEVDGKGIALAGMITNAVALGLSLLLIVGVFLLFAFSAAS